jgi:hypothetical protein
MLFSTIPPKIALKVSYSGCTFLGSSTTVEVNEACSFTIRASGVLSFNSCSIKWSVPGCQIQIGNQLSLNSTSYQNINPGETKEVTMEINVTGISYIATGVSCPKTGIFEDGRYTTGNTILTGAEVGGEGKMTNFWVE